MKNIIIRSVQGLLVFVQVSSIVYATGNDIEISSVLFGFALWAWIPVIAIGSLADTV